MYLIEIVCVCVWLDKMAVAAAIDSIILLWAHCFGVQCFEKWHSYNSWRLHLIKNSWFRVCCTHSRRWKSSNRLTYTGIWWQCKSLALLIRLFNSWTHFSIGWCQCIQFKRRTLFHRTFPLIRLCVCRLLKLSSTCVLSFHISHSVPMLSFRSLNSYRRRGKIRNKRSTTISRYTATNRYNHNTVLNLISILWRLNTMETKEQNVQHFNCVFFYLLHFSTFI